MVHRSHGATPKRAAWRPFTLRRTGALLGLVLMLAGAVRAQSASSTNVALPPRFNLALVAGGGPSSPTRAVSFRTVEFLALQWNSPLDWAPHGFLNGAWSYTIELPIYAIEHERTTWAVGITPIGFRYAMRVGHALQPYVGGLAGMLYANARVPEGANRFNFSPQADAGFTWGEQGEWGAEVRYLHISSGGLHHPNPGVNAVLILARYRF